jgi:hypothetical protein
MRDGSRGHAGVPTAFLLGPRFGRAAATSSFVAGICEPRYSTPRCARDGVDGISLTFCAAAVQTSDVFVARSCGRFDVPSVAAPNNRTTMGSRDVIRPPISATLLKPPTHRRGPTATRFRRPS